MNRVTVRLKRGREKPVLHGHPWIFSGAIESVEGGAAAGDVAEVVSASGEWLARGLIQPGSALTVRLYTRDEAEALDAALFAGRIEQAVALRERLFAKVEDTDAYRLVFAEADGVSGFIADRYADVLSVQLATSALFPHLPAMLDALKRRTGVTRVRVKMETDATETEKPDLSAFNTAGETAVRICERGFLYDVDFAAGQKTGFFLDQRENRRRVAAYAAGRRVLSAYCYTGSFEVHAAAAGATEILGVDRSEAALEKARMHHEINRTAVPFEYRQADAGDALRKLRDARKTFDLIILDPPRFVASRVQFEKGLRGYKDVNLLAMKLLSPGGVLATFSCSGLVSMEHFKMMIGWASVDAGRAVRIVEQLGQPADHPILASFRESEYLKGLICVVT